MATKVRYKLGEENVHRLSASQCAELVQKAQVDGILVWHSFGKWGNRKRLAEEMAKEKFGSDKDAIRAVQDLISRNEWNAVIRPMTQVVDWLREPGRSKAWMHKGVDYIDYGLVPEVNAMFQEKKREMWEAFRNEFAPQYPVLKDDFRKKHPKLYKEENYPSIRYLESSLRFDWGFIDISPPVAERTGNTARAITPELVARQKLEWEERVKEGMQESIQQVRGAFLKIIKYLGDTLTDSTKKFQDSTVEKPKQFLEKISKVPFWGDEPFRELAGDAAKLLDGVEGQDLRDDEEYRRDIGKAVKAMVGEFESLPVIEMDRAVDF